MRLCIVGTGRCGTTLLWRMMNSHPDLFVHRETHWIPALHEAFGTHPAASEAMLDLVTRTRFVTGDPVTKFDADAFRTSRHFRPEATLRDFANGLGSFLAEAEGKTLWADKTPDYGYFMAELQLHWPECRFIHLIRDGVRTASSMSRHIGYRAMAAMRRMHWCPVATDFTPPADGFVPVPKSRYAELWADRLMRTRDEAERLTPGSYTELRHEELMADPVSVLRRLARLAGLAEDTDWLAEASSMIVAGRGTTRPATELVPDWFGERPRALLAALGYPAQ